MHSIDGQWLIKLNRTGQNAQDFALQHFESTFMEVLQQLLV